jgi:hypothetical protein
LLPIASYTGGIPHNKSVQAGLHYALLKHPAVQAIVAQHDATFQKLVKTWSAHLVPLYWNTTCERQRCTAVLTQLQKWVGNGLQIDAHAERLTMFGHQIIHGCKYNITIIEALLMQLWLCGYKHACSPVGNGFDNDYGCC